MTFRSHISIPVVLLIVGIMGVAGYMTYLEGELEEFIPLVLAMVVVFASLLSIRYTITEEGKLLVRALLFKQEYDLQKLDSITPTRSLLSSPAASLRRLRLDFGVGKPLIISPAAQEYFIEEVLRVNPKVKVNV